MGYLASPSPKQQDSKILILFVHCDCMNIVWFNHIVLLDRLWSTGLEVVDLLSSPEIAILHFTCFFLGSD